MRRTAGSGLLAVRTEGGLLSPDLIASLADPAAKLEGIGSEEYHIGTERLGAAITRSWNRMRGEWARFQQTAGRTTPGEAATGVTRDRLLYPLFQELGYGRLVPARGIPVDGKSYAVSHLWNRTPIHLVGHGVDLDKRTSGVAGAAQASPHGLVQELLNRSPDHLWGMVSNGLRLRILRDNRSLTRQAYVELDLESIFQGELYPDFVVLWMLCHQSRVEAERPEQCWLERWSTLGREQGARALDTLRGGVTTAIESLGKGFLSHRANTKLRERLRSGDLKAQEYYRQLLRLVYRLLFLFVAEDRDVLHPRDTPPVVRETYREFYSTHRLRLLAAEIRGTAHMDLYNGFRTVMVLLGTLGAPEMGLPALGSYLWSDEALTNLMTSEIANADLLAAVRALAFTARGKDLWRVDYRNLGSEELGSVYESLLELHPKINAVAGSFSLDVTAGHERKTTGSYYTPHALVQSLLDTALDPVLDEAAKSAKPEQAILNLKVCDPATGSGHFLIAAAHRMARCLASVRTGDEEPSPEATRAALRDVIGRCIYGVDVNPMAVELCKVSLWMEALEPGKPLSFLDAHIQCGNSLLGATPELMAKGIPDEAIGVLTGDDKSTATAHRRRNREERQGQLGLNDETGGFWGEMLPAVESLRAEGLDDSTLAAVRALEEHYHCYVQSEAFGHARAVADAWCAAFVWPRAKGQKLPGLTHGLWRYMMTRPNTVPALVLAEVKRIAATYRFFHWHLAFPEVFEGEGGGFDVVLGNPPWERVKIQKEEWFAAHGREDIASAPNAAARERLIKALEDEDSVLFSAYLDSLRVADAESAFFRRSAAYPLSGTGDVNTYAIFTELATRLVAEDGVAGLIIPTGLATDEQLKDLFATLVDQERLASLTGFENEEFFFPGIANVVRYCAITISGPLRRNPEPRFAFYNRNAEQIRDTRRYYSLTKEELRRLNPNTRTCPIFRTRFDADLTLRLYQRFPILRTGGAADNPWGLSYLAMFHMANDSNLFLSKPNQDSLPLYEAKIFWHYDHRFGSYELKGVLKGKGGRGLPDMPLENHQNPDYSITPQYWVPRTEVIGKLRSSWQKTWLLAFRKTSSAKLERTLAAAILPLAAVNDKAPLILLGPVKTAKAHLFLGCFNSIVLDYIARQKVGGTDVGNFHLDQLPFPTPDDFSSEDDEFIRPRVLELTFTATDVRPFAIDLGWNGKAFRWNPERRFLIQCELDAYYAHLFGLSREEWLFILDPHDIHGSSYPGESFRVLKEKEIARYGEFRTKRVCLEVYDELAASRKSGSEYRSVVDPMPGSEMVTW